MKSLTDIEYDHLRMSRDRDPGWADTDVADRLIARELVVVVTCECGNHRALRITALGLTAMACYEATRGLQGVA